MREPMRDTESTRPVGDGERVVVTTGTSPRTAARAEAAGPVRHTHEEDYTVEREVPEPFNLRRDRVHWGPIWAGLLTALTALLLLSLLGLATGLTSVNAGAAAAQGGPPPETGRNAAIWGAISGILAFLLGGYVAARTAASFHRGWGALNGALVFLLAVPLILWLAGQGLGAVLGSLGSFAGGLNVHPADAQNAAQGAADQARQAAQNVQPVDVARSAERVRNTAWGALAGSLLGLGSSALGGYLGTRRLVRRERVTGRSFE